MTSPDAAPASPPGLSVLFVCTGNVCRSPFAELLLRAQVPGLAVASRGIHALAGEPMERQMAAELARRGGDPEGFRARQVTVADLGADLVLTMSPRQRRFLVEEHPAAARRSGLLGHVPQLAALAAAHGGLDRDVIAQWSRARHPGGQEVPDPYRRPPEVAAATAARLEDLLGQLAPLLAAAR
ncbi:low molecular weight phosphatase family protein [Brachybacterium saurashtrense]|uniref:arsenate reductase/protein-tyrosine-phosphatase family protein n=1 Tax=Brachybacterium saurashtrense TaxID=556288 RepID=UPI0013B38477|nr:low molecular weight phosphatase family protein [Brachybacterium saurashtrense]